MVVFEGVVLNLEQGLAFYVGMFFFFLSLSCEDRPAVRDLVEEKRTSRGGRKGPDEEKRTGVRTRAAGWLAQQSVFAQEPLHFKSAVSPCKDATCTSSLGQ